MNFLKTSLFITFLAASAYSTAAPVVDLNSLPDDSSTSDIVQSNSNSSSNGTAETTAPSFSNKKNLPTEERLRLLEQQIDNLVQMGFPAKIDALQEQVQQLNGQLEEQSHLIEQLKDQKPADLSNAATAISSDNSSQQVPATSSLDSADKPGDVDGGEPQHTNVVKPQNTETAKSGNTGAKKSKDVTTAKSQDKVSAITPQDTASQDTGNGIDQAQSAVLQNKKPATSDVNKASMAYQAAFDLMVKKQTTTAITAFQTFLKTYPDNATYTPNAHYWLGDLYNNNHQTNLAAKEFKILVQKYPAHDKVPDASFNLAVIQDEAGQKPQAKQAFQSIIQKYPHSKVAKFAKMRLDLNT